MRGRLLALALLIAVPAAAAPLAPPQPPSPSPPPPLRIVGYNDMAPMLAALTAAYRRRVPGARFDLSLPGTRSAPPALLAGSADLAPMGAAMLPVESAAIRARWGRAPVAIAVAHDSLDPAALSSPSGAFVHRDNPLRAISLGALRRLFAADAPTATWRSLGVARPGIVRRIGLADTTAIGRFLLNDVLRTPRFPADYTGLPQSRAVAAAVAADPAALGLANLNHAGPGIRALAIVDDAGVRRRPDARTVGAGRWPLDRRLLIYVRRERDGSIAPAPRAFLAFVLSPAGQHIVATGALGYLPLAPHELRMERAKLGKYMQYL